jgi:hypothetical protein
MARRFSPLGAALAVTAAFVMSASPAMARGWGGWRHHRHHDRVDAGDVIAGLLIVGTVAAVASAASKAKRERDYRDGDYPAGDNRDYRESRRYGDDRPDYGSRGGSDYRGAGGIVQALDICAGEVERPDRRIDRVDTVERDSEGWRIEGQTDNGRSFVCSISDSGRVRSVTVGGQAA